VTRGPGPITVFAALAACAATRLAPTITGTNTTGRRLTRSVTIKTLLHHAYRAERPSARADGYGLFTQRENGDVLPVEVSVLVAVRAGLDIAGTVIVHVVVDVVVVPTRVLPSGSLQFGFWNTSIRWVPAPTAPAPPRAGGC